VTGEGRELRRPAERGGERIAAPSASRCSFGSSASSGGIEGSGAIVMTRMPTDAKSRADRQRHADDAAFRREYCRLPDLAVERRDRRGVG